MEAAEERDLPALVAALDALSTDLSPEQVHSLIRRLVLPRLSIKSLLWMWKTLTSPLDQFRVLEELAGKTACRLSKDGFEIGKDFSFEGKEGYKRLLISRQVKHHLEEVLSKSSLVSLQLLTRHKHLSR